MRKRVKQRDLTDCGAACLASIVAHFRYKIPVARIRQFAGTDKKGTNVLGLIEAADRMGFIAKGVKSDWESLFKIPKPSIAHIVKKEGLHHYVVIIATGKIFIKIMDPEDGKFHKVPHEEFKKSWTGVLVLIAPGERFERGNKCESLTNRIWCLIKPNSGILIQSLAGALVFSILGLSISIYVGKIVDNVLPEGNLNLLNLLGITMVLITIARLLLNSFQSIFILRTGQKIDASLILGYYNHLLKLPQTFFDSMRTGEIISRISDAVKIRVFINDISINMILSIFILIASLCLMFAFYWKLALIILCIIPVHAVIYLISNKFNRVIQRRIMEKAADLESHLVESITSARTLKSLNLEAYSNQKTESRFVSFLEPVYKSGLINIFSSGSSAFISQIMTIVLLWAGAGYVLNTIITPGELLSFYTLTGYFTGPVISIIAFNRTLQDARIASDRLFEIFDLDTDDESGKMEIKEEMTGDINFENVSFRYGTRVDVFDSLNLCIKKGEITAITGESGSGKTTIISLIQKIYAVNKGRIRIGSFDFSNISIRSLRRIIAVVPQSIDVFEGSVLENIAIGDWEPDVEKVVSICDHLGMSGFIEDMPHGYLTYLGEKGVSLSGGQRQRIGIARALYRDPQVLILDEATSAMDALSEEYVKRAMTTLRDKGKTVILIAHRLSTLKLADRIIVLENGRVTQEGSFEELSKVGGLFRRLLTLQCNEINNSDN
ncbi:MAG TPA: peptidase domain-containing ABC transporter [Bacteroidales bacterium]|nr:peptidase domain-containing ABC transporter [Bacteroidales bacterium]